MDTMPAMSTKNQLANMSIRLPQEHADRVEAIAEECRWTRSQAAAVLIEEALAARDKAAERAKRKAGTK